MRHSIFIQVDPGNSTLLFNAVAKNAPIKKQGVDGATPCFSRYFIWLAKMDSNPCLSLEMTEAVRLFKRTNVLTLDGEKIEYIKRLLAQHPDIKIVFLVVPTGVEPVS